MKAIFPSLYFPRKNRARLLRKQRIIKIIQ